MTSFRSLDQRLKWNTLAGQRLAEGIDLQTQLKEASWNVKRTLYTSLHELFDEIAWEVACYTDMVAERIIQLGGIARGTVRAAAIRSRLREYPGAIGSLNHVKAVTRALADFCQHTRDAAREATTLGDRETAKLFIEISHGVERWLWYFQGRSKSPERSYRNRDRALSSLFRTGAANRQLKNR